MTTPEFEEGEFIRYVVEGPILALLQAEDGVGVALGTHPGECMVISGRSLKFIQRGPDPRDAEIKRLRARADDSATLAGEPLHAHELSSDDAAMIRMLAGANFGPETSATLPSGRQVTGAEMARWVNGGAQ